MRRVPAGEDQFVKEAKTSSLRLYILITVLLCTTTGLLFTIYSLFNQENTQYTRPKPHARHGTTASGDTDYLPRIYTPPTVINRAPNNDK